MTIHTHSKKNLLSIPWIISFIQNTLKGDLIAGLCVACITLPQALGYALIADLPVSSGITAAIIGTAIGALCTSSSRLILGPTNASALILQATCLAYMKDYVDTSNHPVSFIHVAAVLTLLIGVIQLLFSAFRLGKLIQFVSHSVIAGYIVGTAIALIIGQLFPLAGISLPSHLVTVYEKVVYFVGAIATYNPFSLLLGLLCLGLIFYLHVLRCKIPSALILLLTIPPFAHFSGITKQCSFPVETVTCSLQGGTLSNMVYSLPCFDVALINSLLPAAFAIALIGMLEVNSIARSIATKTGDKISPNQETFSLGFANFVLSFFSGMPCSGSASRTAINHTCGARSKCSALFSSIFIAAFIFFFSPYIQYIPKPCIAAILCSAAIKLIDLSHILFCIRATKADSLVFLVTVISCLFLQLSLAFYVGIALSILLYLQKASVPIVEEFVYDEENAIFCPKKHASFPPDPHIRIVNVEGELFFGSTDLFQGTLRAFADTDVSSVILIRLKHVHDVDATLAVGLKQLKMYLLAHKRHLVICNVPAPVMELLQRTGLTSFLEEENIIPHDPHHSKNSLQRAWKRAEYLHNRGLGTGFDLTKPSEVRI